MTDLFIGLVSHEGSRYSINQGPSGLAMSLRDSLTGLGVSVQVAVNTRNDWTPEFLNITPEIAFASVEASLNFEQTWYAYLVESAGTGRPLSRLRKSLEFRARILKLRWRPRSRDFLNKSITGVQRLLNIELSHVFLWQSGIESGARWILIIEDDGGCEDIADLAGGLAGLIENLDSPHIGSRYVNISTSFSASQLGVTHLLESAPIAWAGSETRIIQTASKPVTNTVCAILYSAGLIAQLLSEFESAPVSPVIPIDFKLNAALMALYANGKIKAGDCLQVEPAPIVQMSMHEMG